MAAAKPWPHQPDPLESHLLDIAERTTRELIGALLVRLVDRTILMPELDSDELIGTMPAHVMLAVSLVREGKATAGDLHELVMDAAGVSEAARSWAARSYSEYMVEAMMAYWRSGARTPEKNLALLRAARALLAQLSGIVQSANTLAQDYMESGYEL